MGPKAKKAKKKSETKIKQNVLAIEKFLKPEEINEVKSILKTKEMLEFPLMIGAVILNKLKLVRTLHKKGYDLDELGPNNWTPLIWAIKSNFTEIIDFLLTNGSDPYKLTSNGENAIIIALENKMWTEEMFLGFWTTVENNRSKVNVNIYNKHGHSMLHIAVRREWEQVVKLLIARNANVNVGNTNGVTPLMMACFRNNFNIVFTLTAAKADVLTEDTHGRLALCYAITSDFKNKSAFSITTHLIGELTKFTTMKQYLKRRLEFMFMEKSFISLPTAETFINIIKYTVQFLEDGIKWLIDLRMVEQLHKVLKKSMTSPHLLNFFLSLTMELLFYNEQSAYFNADFQYLLVKRMVRFNILNSCLEILRNFKKYQNCAAVAFYVLLLLCTNAECGQMYFKQNRGNIINVYKTLPVDYVNNFSRDFSDERRLKLMKRKMKKFKRSLFSSSDKSMSENFECDKMALMDFRKKVRKRPKSARSVDFIRERSVTLVRPKNGISTKITIRKPMAKEVVVEESNPICKGVLQFLEKDSEEPERVYNPAFPQWKLHILNLPFEDNINVNRILNIDKDKLKDACNCLRQLANSKKTPPRNIINVVNVYIDYLKAILNYIIEKYENYWRMDKLDCYGDEMSLINYDLYNTEKLEQQIVSDLCENFNILVDAIKKLVFKNISVSYVNLCQLEEKLLRHAIRGKSLLYELTNMETIRIKHTPITVDEKCNVLFNYMEDVLNDRVEPRDDIKIQVYSNDERSPTKTELENSFEKNMVKCYHSTSVWSKIVENLQMEELFEFLAGDVKLCLNPAKCTDYIISQHGNFNQVYLGVSKTNEALAVKRISKECAISKLLRSLIIPLLGLRNINLLSYIYCDYDKNELILATHLTEFNVGQYVLKMKETVELSSFTLTAMDVIRQFLAGLRFLHERKQPIVHGNLKPSNVFVDLNGTVRLGEFGIHQALYKIIEAPNSSLIWFSPETYQIYKESSLYECNFASDIHVAGMLIYFILTGGTHPYGSNLIVILKNLETGLLNLPKIYDLLFLDLVKWMIMYDPNERPQINQVLSHIMFWSSRKRWRFILTCAGINQKGIPLNFNVQELHKTIDAVSIEEKIEGNWVDIIQNKFKKINVCGSNTVTGLLSFIKNFYQQETELDIKGEELSDCVLTYFPTFPLTLYRILEVSNWLEEPIFLPFTKVVFIDT